MFRGRGSTSWRGRIGPCGPLLLLYVALTTFNADLPVEAQYKWVWVWKVLLFAAFLPLAIWNRLRIEALMSAGQ